MTVLDKLTEKGEEALEVQEEVAPEEAVAEVEVDHGDVEGEIRELVLANI